MLKPMALVLRMTDSATHVGRNSAAYCAGAVTYYPKAVQYG